MSMSSQCSCPACTALQPVNINMSYTTGPTTARLNITTPYWTPALSSSTPTSIAPHLIPTPLAGFYHTPNHYIKWSPTPSSLIVHRPNHRLMQYHLPPLVPQTFSNFSRLPPELRLRIWALSASNPRVIELRTWKPSNRLSPLKISAGPHSPPPILHVNRESRLEGLRIYQIVEIGVSVWAGYNESELYIPWMYHPRNEFADREYQVWSGRPGIPRWWRSEVPDKVMPYAPQRIYLDYNKDTIYLGPEFSPQHLEKFLTTSFPQELPALQYLALDRKLWLRSAAPRATWEPLRNSLYALKSRPIKEVYIVPDDERDKLEDRWYYGKHDLVLKDPMWNYSLKVQSAAEKTVLENLSEWFDRVWGDGQGIGKGKGAQGGSDERRGVDVKRPPKVCIKSVRRAGKSISDYKEGMGEVQQNLGNMVAWKTWTPYPTGSYVTGSHCDFGSGSG